MLVRCAWCGKDMGGKPGEGVEGVSHGMCRECWEKQCPFAYLARHCPHQETYAQDVSAAIEGKMVFICTLDESGVCPYFQRAIEE